jgi:Na+/melibiose symporter-like transporter
MIYGGLISVIGAMSFSFISDFIGLIAVLFILGLGLGGFLLMLAPVFSEVIDESVVQTKQRNEGLFGGLRMFMTNFARVLMAIIFTIVHELTGFVEASDIQPLSAVMGIQLHSGFIPGILMLVGVLIFWKFYDITPKKALQIKEKMKELNL